MSKSVSPGRTVCVRYVAAPGSAGAAAAAGAAGAGCAAAESCARADGAKDISATAHNPPRWAAVRITSRTIPFIVNPPRGATGDGTVPTAANEWRTRAVPGTAVQGETT